MSIKNLKYLACFSLISGDYCLIFEDKSGKFYISKDTRNYFDEITEPTFIIDYCYKVEYEDSDLGPIPHEFLNITSSENYIMVELETLYNIKVLDNFGMGTHRELNEIVMALKQSRPRLFGVNK